MLNRSCAFVIASLLLIPISSRGKKRWRYLSSFKGQVMSAKHVKLNRPTNVDLVRNPLIGAQRERRWRE
jgi:hypothetical protein